MGRRKKTIKTVQRHLRINQDIDYTIETEAKRKGVSYTEYTLDLLQKGLRREAGRYKGFKEISMGHDFICFECQRRFKAGKRAMYDNETGATMCIECAITNEMTTKTVTKLIIQTLRLKRDVKALKIEREEEAKLYFDTVRKLEELSFAEDLTEMDKRWKKLNDLFLRFLNSTGDPYDLENLVKECHDLLQEIKILKSQQEAKILKHLRVPYVPKKKKKKQLV